MSNTKQKFMSALLILSLVFTMFVVNTIPAHAATKTLKLKASASGQTQAVLTWNKISKPYNGYAVFRDGKVIKYFGKSTTKFTDSGLASGSAHSYQIKSYKKTKQYYNSKKKKWQTSKPKASQWKGKKTRYVYSYKTKSNVVSIRTAYAYYTITWKNWNGATLATTSIRQGLTPSYSGTPTRPNDNNYAYNFTGWSPSITAASGNKTYTAQYKAISLYTIKWMNYDGTILRTDKVKSGVVPKYNGSTPTRPADTDNTYTFKGWSPTIVAAKGNATYLAQYNKIPKPIYSIKWNNYNGTTLTTTAVKQGVVPSYTGTTPKRTGSDTVVYDFIGWDPTPVAAKGNTTYTAQFKAVPKYRIDWLNWDNSIIRTDYVRSGVKPSFIGTPTRPADDNYVYNFIGWNTTIVPASGNASYRAQYEQVPKNTTVDIVWKNYNGNILDSKTIPVGTIPPAYSGPTPTKPEDDNYVYEFNGFTASPSITGPATTNITYTAKFKTYQKYTITWKDWDETTILQTTRVRSGLIPTYPGATPTKPETDKYTYEFIGWTPEIVAVTGNATYVANFRPIAKPELTEFDYSIHFLNEPYTHGDNQGGVTVVYVDTNNPDVWDYELCLLNSSNQEKKLNISQAFYPTSSNTTTSYQDLSLPISRGYLVVCRPECTGNCTFIVREYDDSGEQKIVASRSVNIKDYTAEEAEWRQSVINEVTNSSMTNVQKMDAICDYLLANFNYTKVPMGSSPDDGGGYVQLISDLGVPFWVEKRLNSYTSPKLLEKFGQDLGYTLHNCYGDYTEWSPDWITYHMYVYSEADDRYFKACPTYSTGMVDLSTIVMFNPNTYNFWGE